MNFVYAACLIGSAACIALLDWRFRLAFWGQPARSWLIVVLGVAFFGIWDAIGIVFGVFRHTDSSWATGILLAPHFPLEELLFIVFLSYLTLVLLAGSARLRQRRERP
ncbi:lycopene cyclase domain-containing protein [Paramicrobacterium fandaimingii]|uniref:lycopene cyclase domain-containing protein n=1 Tax=Paramicrobacterium fandaimingii TaxID=2708079 RepID=UPI001422B866|nr:lycopene cyclase domain-containing protein [Microbacterium fandaimingii]